MIVYIEYAILDNMAMDMVLLYLVGITIGSRARWGRLICGSIVGTMCALAVPLVGSVWGYTIKAVCLVAMCIIAFGRGRLAISMLLLVVYTFLMGGMIIGLLSLFGVQYSIDNMTCNYYSSVPIGLYIVAVVLCIVLALCVVQYIRGRRVSSSGAIDIVLCVGGEHIGCTGYIDSGNLLAIDDVPVCFVCGRLGRRVAHHIAVALIAGSVVRVSYTTMSGSGSSVAIEGSIAMGSNICTVLLCVASASSAHGCDVLINYKLMEGNI